MWMHKGKVAYHCEDCKSYNGICPDNAVSDVIPDEGVQEVCPAFRLASQQKTSGQQDSAESQTDESASADRIPVNDNEINRSVG